MPLFGRERDTPRATAGIQLERLTPVGVDRERVGDGIARAEAEIDRAPPGHGRRLDEIARELLPIAVEADATDEIEPIGVVPSL